MLLLLLLFYMHYILFVCVCAHMPWYLCGRHRSTCRSCFSPPTMWVLELELWALSLAVGAFTCSAILLAPVNFMLYRQSSSSLQCLLELLFNVHILCNAHACPRILFCLSIETAVSYLYSKVETPWFFVLFLSWLSNRCLTNETPVIQNICDFGLLDL